MYTWL